MTKAPSSLQDLRRRIYRKAKSDRTHRFWGLFVHVTKLATLEEAYRVAKGNGGAPGIDGHAAECECFRPRYQFQLSQSKRVQPSEALRARVLSR
jgi:hypothetical protein